jgi:uncharacterized protein YndB with AHSA1/START domain
MSGIVRPDSTTPDAEVRLSIVIEAPSEKVFRALTDPDVVAKWFSLPSGKWPVIEPRVDGIYDLGWTYDMHGKPVTAGTTRILEMIENERLVTDWLDWRGDPARQRQRVAWHLENLGGRTRVTLVHDGFERPADVGDYPFGWRTFLDGLKNAAEGTN